MQRRIVPHVVTGEQRLAMLPRAASVQDAVVLMYRRKIGAVMIVEDDRLLGIFTERDLARCTAMHMELDATPLGLVMTWKPKTVPPTETPIRALQRMREGGFRHLPVVDEGRVVGMVSVRDLFETVQREMDPQLHGGQTLVQHKRYASQAA